MNMVGKRLVREEGVTRVREVAMPTEKPRVVLNLQSS